MSSLQTSNEPPPELFAQTRTRRTDPQTSRDAAERFARAGKVKSHADRIMAALGERGGLTAPEIGQRAGLNHMQVDRRVSELIRDGLIFREGERGGFSVLWRTK